MPQGILIKIAVDDKGNAKILDIGKNAKKVQKDIVDLDGVMKKVFAAGAVIYGIRAIGTGFQAATSEVIKYELALKRIQGIGQMAGTELDKAGKAARKLATETEYSASTIANSMLELVKAGFQKSEDLIQAVPSVLNLATASMMDLNYAATNTLSTMRQFNMGNEETARVANVMAGVLNATGSDAEDFMESMKYAGTVANVTGMSFEETAAMLGVLADAGIKGSQAGTTLRQMFLSLMQPTEATKKGLEKLNISGKTLSEVLYSLKQNGYTVLDFLEQFDKRAITGVLRLADDKAADKIKNLNIDLLNQMVTIGGISDTIRTSLDSTLKILVNNLNEVVLSIFDAFGPRPKDALDGIIKSVQDLDKWVDSNQDKIRELADVAGKVIEVAEELAKILGGVLLTGLDNLGLVVGLLATSQLPKLLRGFNSVINVLPSLTTATDQLYTTSFKVKENFAWYEKAKIPGAINTWTTSFEGLTAALAGGALAGGALYLALDQILRAWNSTLDRNMANVGVQTTPEGMKKQYDLVEKIKQNFDKIAAMEEAYGKIGSWTKDTELVKRYNALIRERNDLERQYIGPEGFGGRDAYKVFAGDAEAASKTLINLHSRMYPKFEEPKSEDKPTKKPKDLDIVGPENIFDILKKMEEESDSDLEEAFKNTTKVIDEAYQTSLENRLISQLENQERSLEAHKRHAEQEKEIVKSMSDSYWSMGESITSVYETIAEKKLQIAIESAEKEKQLVEDRFDTEIRLASGSAWRREMLEQRKAQAIVEAEKKVEAAKNAMEKRQRFVSNMKATADVTRAIIGTIAETHGNAALRIAAGLSVGALAGGYLAQLVSINYRDGGLVTGPGNTTSDSVPAVLSQGEWVLKARDVDRLGGPSGVQEIIDRGVTNNNRQGDIYITGTVLGTKQFVREVLLPDIRKELRR